MAAARAFQSVEERDEGAVGFAVDKIDIDEIIIGSMPTFAAKIDLRPIDAERGINGLEMASWQPGRGSVSHSMQQRGDRHVRRRFARFY